MPVDLSFADLMDLDEDKTNAMLAMKIAARMAGTKPDPIPPEPSIVNKIDWEKLMEIANRTVFPQKVLLDIAIDSFGRHSPSDLWMESSSMPNQKPLLFKEVFYQIRVVDDSVLARKLIRTMLEHVVNVDDIRYLSGILSDPEPEIPLPNPITTITDLWISCSGLANALINLPDFLNKQIAAKNPEIRINHMPNALHAIRMGLPNLAVLLSKNDYLDAQKSLEELQVRYDRYIDWLNKGYQRTATLDEINNYFTEELDGWIGKSFLPTMERVCSKRTDNFDSNKDKTQ
jgi:hypothetical protein